jgi:putative flippase GtrA
MVYIGLMALLLNVLGLNYRVCVSVAYLVAIALHFLLNRHITFRAADSHAIRQAWRYLTMAAINYVVTLAVVSVVVDVLNWSVYIGLFLALVATIVVGYVLSKLWVFRVSEDPNG